MDCLLFRRRFSDSFLGFYQLDVDRTLVSLQNIVLWNSCCTYDNANLAVDDAWFALRYHLPLCPLSLDLELEEFDQVFHLRANWKPAYLIAGGRYQPAISVVVPCIAAS